MTFAPFLLAVCAGPPSLDGKRTAGSQAARAERPMDQRIESFLTDVLALAGEDPDAAREGVRAALADCERHGRDGDDGRAPR